MKSYRAVALAKLCTYIDWHDSMYVPKYVGTYTSENATLQKMITSYTSFEFTYKIKTISWANLELSVLKFSSQHSTMSIRFVLFILELRIAGLDT
jgi:hypothetical protein